MAAGLFHQRKCFLIEYFASGARRKRPLNLDSLVQQCSAECDNPIALDDRSEVVELDASNIVFQDICLDFLNNFRSLP